ncbi:MAG: TRZ/ATZ family hydrolase [Burkholderiales bacterium]|nr:TRZ/ATZ family hydrolase [Burkholderiales bacterium]
MDTTLTVDLCVEARHVVPVDRPGLVLDEHAVVVEAGRILDLLPIETARARYAAREYVRLPTHVVLPGLVNVHTHAAMALMRGLADDLPLMEWLNRHIWPAEAQHVSTQMVRDGTLLACAEMIRGGITCFNDMYFFPEEAGRAALSVGMRAALGMICIEIPTAYASDAQDYLHKGLAMRDAFKHESLLSFCMAPHAPYTVQNTTFERIVTYAEELQVPIHLHLHETLDEIRESMQRFGMRPLQRMQRLGVVGPGLIAVHAVHLEADEIELLRACGSHVAHCPSSNLKLGSGIAPLSALLAAGVNVALGTDSAASNNRLDILQEARTAALLAKGSTGQPTTVPAEQALHLCTLGGARALGLEHAIGSITPGKYADLTAVNLDACELAPRYHPISHLVYAVGRENVSDVWVAGRHLLDNRRFTTLDETELAAKAAFWQQRLAAQA